MKKFFARFVAMSVFFRLFYFSLVADLTLDEHEKIVDVLDILRARM